MKSVLLLSINLFLIRVLEQIYPNNFLSNVYFNTFHKNVFVHMLRKLQCVALGLDSREIRLPIVVVIVIVLIVAVAVVVVDVVVQSHLMR